MRIIKPLALVLALLCLFACTPEWEMELPDKIVLPGDVTDASTSPAQSYTPIMPPGIAKSHMFGLAWVFTDNFNPFTANTRNKIFVPLICESLFEIGEDFEPVKLLCGEYSFSEDEQTVSVTPLNDIFFSDGSPLTVSDIIWSFEESKKAGLVPSSVTASADGQNVCFTFSADTVRPLTFLTFPIVKRNSYYGTGPYIFTIEDNGDHALTINSFYRGSSSVAIPRIDLLDVTDETLVSFYFQYGHISLIGYDFLSPLEVGIQSGYERRDFITSTFQYIGINPFHEQLSEKHLRQALSLVFNRTELCGEVFFGQAVPTLLAVPPNSPLYDAAEDGLSADFRAAALELTLLGASDDDSDGVLELPSSGRKRVPLKFQMLVNTGNPARLSAAQRFADACLPLGIEITVVTKPLGEYQQTIASGGYDMYWGQVTLSPDFSSYDFACNIIPVCFNKRSLLFQRGLFSVAAPSSFNLLYRFTDWILGG